VSSWRARLAVGLIPVLLVNAACGRILGSAGATPAPTDRLEMEQVRLDRPPADFPLAAGSYWVYSHHEYWENQTETGIITATIVENKVYDSLFMARWSVEQSNPAQWVPLGLGEGAAEFWYALDERGQLFLLPDLESADQLEQATLAYLLPFVRVGCWFRSPESWNALGENCTMSEGPQERHTPAGVFSECYWIVTPYLSGGTQEWVCRGVGFAGAKYDHIGSPFGYETTLLEYRIGPP
jgi:hypothetical protein